MTCTSAPRPQSNSASRTSTYFDAYYLAKYVINTRAEWPPCVQLARFTAISHVLQRSRKPVIFNRFTVELRSPLTSFSAYRVLLVLEHDWVVPIVPLKICNSRTKLPVVIYRNVPTSRQNLKRSCPFRIISLDIKCYLYNRPCTVADGLNPKLF